MTNDTRDYDDIPGTYVQDGRRTRAGYALNSFMMTLNKAEGRDTFRAGERECLERYAITAEQRDAVLSRDWLRILQLGGNIYYMLKLAAYDRVSVQHLCGQMGGVSEQEFTQMMINGGRSLEGNRSTKERR